MNGHNRCKYIVTASPELQKGALHELRALAANLRKVAGLGDGVLLVETGVARGEVLEALGRADPVLVKHTHPVDVEVALKGDRRHDLAPVLAALREAGTLAAGGGKAICRAEFKLLEALGKYGVTLPGGWARRRRTRRLDEGARGAGHAGGGGGPGPRGAARQEPVPQPLRGDAAGAEALRARRACRWGRPLLTPLFDRLQSEHTA